MFRAQKRIIETEKAITPTDLKAWMGADVNLDAVIETLDNHKLIARKEIPRQVAWMIGLRGRGGRVSYVPYNSSNNPIHGRLLICYADHPLLNRVKVIEISTQHIDLTKPLDRTQNPTAQAGVNTPLAMVKERSYLEFWFEPETSGQTIDYDNVNTICCIDYVERSL